MKTERSWSVCTIEEWIMNNSSDFYQRVNVISFLIYQNGCMDYFLEKGMLGMLRLNVNGEH